MRPRIEDYIIIEEAEYLLANKATVREVGVVFNRSKSSVHYDMRKHLPKIDQTLAAHVIVLLETNLAERATRGGKARWERRN